MASRSGATTSFLAAAAAAAIVATSLLYREWNRRGEAAAETSDKERSMDAAKKKDDDATPRSGNLKSSNNSKDTSSSAPPPPFSEIDLNSPSKYARLLGRNTVTIVHGSMTGTTRKFAHDLESMIQQRQARQRSNGSNKKTIQLISAADESVDWWDELINNETKQQDGSSSTRTSRSNNNDSTAWLILLLPTYTNGTWPPCTESLKTALQDLVNDWRIAQAPLKNQLRVAVFGMGSSAYHETTAATDASANNSHETTTTMGRPAKQAVRFLTKLGAKCPLRLVVGDDAVGTHAQDAFEGWSRMLMEQLERTADSAIIRTKNGSGASAVSTRNNVVSAIPEDEELVTNDNDHADMDSDNQSEQEDYDSDEDGDDEDNREPEIVDVEDMGDAVMAATTKDGAATSELPDMVTPSQAKALKKEGYQLIGTHSAVKLCRWTKHQLRGRGGCYKHTFYGITSYQCMEATPSLACANKCVFCWRHHKNPVGKEWKWKTDDPKFIVQEAVDKHVQLIRQAKGIPGVRMDRWRDALTPKHCALSLVGEPIMYPHIDGLLGELHARDISTFLVTNGQHPYAIETLRPITQLYVSVDAPTQQSLIEIDRPLFSDAWDRLKQSLSCLKAKGQRTVARLTVVKGWNSDEISGYAKLIALGKVSLVEVKGVTFCGKSDASNLNMTNTPWHHEVVDLTRTLRDELAKLREAGEDVPEYGLACEHKHSCSVLLARVDQFLRKDPVTGATKWHTWIDYPKFQQLAARNAEDSSFTFAVEDYIAETPSWALFGADEEGFDPTDKRHRKATKQPMYTRYDDEGIPTHDSDDVALSADERKKMKDAMLERMKVLGSGSTVTELKGGEKQVVDVSLMYRGLVVAK